MTTHIVKSFSWTEINRWYVHDLQTIINRKGTNSPFETEEELSKFFYPGWFESYNLKYGEDFNVDLDSGDDVDSYEITWSFCDQDMALLFKLST